MLQTRALSPGQHRDQIWAGIARIQGREILRVSPKFDMGTYAQSLTYKDPEDSRRSLEALARAFAPVVVVHRRRL